MQPQMSQGPMWLQHKTATLCLFFLKRLKAWPRLQRRQGLGSVQVEMTSCRPQPRPSSQIKGHEFVYVYFVFEREVLQVP